MESLLKHVKEGKKEVTVKRVVVRHSGASSVGKAVAMLTNLLGITVEDSLWMFGAHMMDYPDTHDRFMAMPNDELRFRWLEERRRIYALSPTARPLSTNYSLFKYLPTSS